MSKNPVSFLDYIKSEDFDAAESLIAEDIFAVEDLMDEYTEEDFEKIEAHWSAVNTGDSISTPFFVLNEISKIMNFKPGSTIIDLGSGHGKPSLLFGALNPEVKVVGYEIVPEKVFGSIESAKRLGVTNLDFLQQDLSDEDFKLPLADYYYSFNPVNEEVAVHLAEQIKKHSLNNSVQIICSDEGVDNTAFKYVGFKPSEIGILEWGIEVLTNR